MTHAAEEFPSEQGISFSGKLARASAALGFAFVLASAAAAWNADVDLVAWISDPSSSAETGASSFDHRFSPASIPNPYPTDLALGLLLRSVPSDFEAKVQQSKDRLAEKLRGKFREVAVIDDPARPPVVAAVPLPRSRPADANREEQSSTRSTPVAQFAAESDNRSLLQKISDLIPARIKLASLTPDDGLFRSGPNLGALGYDQFTAVYDITARTVYMPDGSKLEAHSGLGDWMDDPEHVDKRMVGATPPNVYDLKPREQLFHGVEALRMIPADGTDALGRSGLLAHSYMLGPNGDSNGCVSIKNYEKFLAAFKNGEIKRLIVVASLKDGTSTSRGSPSQS